MQKSTNTYLDDADLSLYIDGVWRKGRGGKHEVIDPSTEQALARLSLADARDLDDALAAAQHGFATWRRVPAAKRAAILELAARLMHERADAIGRLMSQEQGKLLAESIHEVRTAADIVKWFAEEGRRAYGRVVPGPLAHSRQLVLREPVGPIAAFSPWNFPVRIPARTVAAAMAAGCSVVLKPAEETPASTAAMVRCFHDAGLPAGVLNLVFGEPAQVSQHLIASPVIRGVAFTGSVPVGKQLLQLAAQDVKKVVMELGGHAPVIVCEDADIEQVAPMLAKAKFRSAGQACISPTRFYVHRHVHGRFVDAFLAATREVRPGGPFDIDANASPLANRRRLGAIESLVSDAVAQGGRILEGGYRLDRPGLFFAPTVIDNVPESARIMSEEPFGPVVPLAIFDTLDEVIARANQLAVGLAAYAFTASDRNALRLSNELEAGMIGINSLLISGPEVPFGGVKQSGIGSENGIEGLQAYQVTKFVQHATV